MEIWKICKYTLPSLHKYFIEYEDISPYRYVVEEKSYSLIGRRCFCHFDDFVNDINENLRRSSRKHVCSVEKLDKYNKVTRCKIVRRSDTIKLRSVTTYELSLVK